MKTPQQVHLLVLCHGLWGEPVHMNEMARTIREKFPLDAVDGDGIKLRLLLAETNSLDSTYDGIDWGGERAADEVQKKIKEIEEDREETVTRFSVVGYSLGGLLSRYMIGVLESRKFFDSVKPVNFATFATPHIGLVKMNNFFSKLGFNLGPKMLSRTGPHLYGTDSWSPSGQTLLEALADPNGIFYKGLNKFERKSLYGSAYGDRTVSYQTALIEENDPFWDHETSGVSFTVDEKYSPIISSYEIPSRPPTPPLPPATGSAAHLKAFVPRVRLPPFLQLRFPLNIILYMLLPILIPMGLTAAFVKVSIDQSHSRKRLKLLEKDDSFQHRLVNVLQKLDKNMENAIAEMIEEAGEQAVEVDESTGQPLVVPSSPVVKTAPSKPDSEEGKALRCSSKRSKSKERLPKDPNEPQLSDTQRRIIASMNTIDFHKYSAHFPGVFSSHAVIISRDVQRFAFHKQGEGVLRHWADHFIL